MSAPLREWTCAPLGMDVRKSLERLAALDGAAHVAVMPDVHLAHDVCIGTVLAMRGAIVPAAVGGDIGCGMSAVAFDADAARLDDPAVAARVLGGLAARVPIVKHGGRQGLPDELVNVSLSLAMSKRRDRDGAFQLGTLGRGNHFLELQADDEERLWLMVHSGSRGMGVAIRDHHVRASTQSGLVVLPAQSEEGRAYFADHSWALRYAEWNRRRLIAAASDVISNELGTAPRPDTLATCHHNHVCAELHFGETWFVHRKGAISADEGEPGIIPGSMGTASFHTSGRGHPPALRSSSHGAGRTMSRSEARRRVSLRAFRSSVQGVWFDHRKERRLLDEAPAAYRDIDAVMRAQRELTRVVRRLRPVLSFKGT